MWQHEESKTAALYRSAQDRHVCVCVRAQSHATLCDNVDRSLSGSSVHGIFQARIV